MKRKKFEWTGRLILIIFSLILVLSLIFFITKQTHKNTTEQLLTEYMNYINKHEYEKMYKMISKEHSSNISMEEFVKRNKNIYEGLETKDLSIKILNEKSNGKEISYLTSFNTLAGEVKFQNEVNFIKEKFEYKLVWKDSIIFPQLESTDKVRIDTVEAERGQILDRNGKVLAGKGVASSVGLVPGKIQDKENTIIKLAELLEVDIDVIKNKLSAEWVKDDSFVPIKTIPKVSELELMKINPDENLVKLKENQEELLSIPGVMINDIEVRDYPLKEAASHLVGYIQKVTAEDLEENKGKGYDSNSVIGRSGIESLYEDKLKGQNGCMIYIEDEFGNRKDIIVDKPVQNGEDIQLTIDAELQKVLYEQFKDDKSCSVAMNQYTGEVLALVSTPSFNSNDFVMGMSDKLWKSLNEDERQQHPLVAAGGRSVDREFIQMDKEPAGREQGSPVTVFKCGPEQYIVFRVYIKGTASVLHCSSKNRKFDKGRYLGAWLSSHSYIWHLKSRGEFSKVRATERTRRCRKST